MGQGRSRRSESIERETYCNRKWTFTASTLRPIECIGSSFAQSSTHSNVKKHVKAAEDSQSLSVGKTLDPAYP